MLDASAAGRWLIQGDPTVPDLLRRAYVSAPSFITLEVANALLGYLRIGVFDLETARGIVTDLHDARLDLVPVETLAETAVVTASILGLSAYDAAYVVLAETREATLVTADRRLAAAYEPVELIA